MARLDFIAFRGYQASLDQGGTISWEEDADPAIDGLPQIFWKDGRPWDEVNAWALERARSGIDLETVKRTMKHLARLASYIESEEGLDWRHFPIRKDKQVLQKFRGFLIKEREAGSLEGSTTTNCMNAVIQFYRFAGLHGLVDTRRPLWKDSTVLVPFYDAMGFKRTLLRVTTDLKIPNRSRSAAQLEDGLLPLREQHMTELLRFMAEAETTVLSLMLSFGFFTGARIGTIVTLTVSSLDSASEDALTPGLFWLPVGPGTGISTKFSVKGKILLPKDILEDLKVYSTSNERLLRQVKTVKENKNLLFLTERGQAYSVSTVNRLVNGMRSRASLRGMKYMEKFKFHQSRATFGTWLTSLLLNAGVRSSDALEFVRNAMLHKDIRVTMRYIKFLEDSKAKQVASAAYTAAFTGLANRNWNNYAP